MRIMLERSGGFTGIPVLNEIDAKDLPSKLVIVAKKIIADQKSYSPPMKLISKGPADYYSYKISIQDGNARKIIECNDFNIQDDIKQIVRFIERFKGSQFK